MNATEEASQVTPITLTGPSIRLRAVTREDYGFLWECRCHPDVMHLWMQGRGLPSFEQYVRELDNALAGTILTLLMIEGRASRRTLGFVFAYDYSPYDRLASWTIVIHPAYSQAGWGAEAALLFCDYLFAFFDLRKLYTDIYAFNRHSLRLMLRMGAREEGRFLAHRYYQGAYHDVIRLAGTRDEWHHARARAAAIFSRHQLQARRERSSEAAGPGAPDADMATTRASEAPARASQFAVVEQNGHVEMNGHNGHIEMRE